MVEPISIERRKLFQQVADHIERQILEGKLKPGDRLPPERDLQALLGVGRPAIREALIALQKAGLVEITNGAPARIAMPSAEGILSSMVPAVRHLLSTREGQRHLQHARLFLETGLARYAARNASATELARLGDALEANRLAVGNRDAFIRTDVAFHFVLAEISGNPVFIALYHAMSSWLEQQRIVTLGLDGQEKTAFAAHRKIYKAILAGDPDQAEIAMHAHLAQLEQAYWRAEPEE